jgi:hypothetical protein
VPLCSVPRTALACIIQENETRLRQKYGRDEVIVAAEDLTPGPMGTLVTTSDARADMWITDWKKDDPCHPWPVRLQLSVPADRWPFWPQGLSEKPPCPPSDPRFAAAGSPVPPDGRDGRRMLPGCPHLTVRLIPCSVGRLTRECCPAAKGRTLRASLGITEITRAIPPVGENRLRDQLVSCAALRSSSTACGANRIPMAACSPFVARCVAP